MAFTFRGRLQMIVFSFMCQWCMAGSWLPSAALLQCNVIYCTWIFTAMECNVMWYMNLHCNPANNHWPHTATGITISAKDVGNNAGRGLETGTLIFYVLVCTGLTIKQISRYLRNIYIKTVWFVWSNVWCVNAVTWHKPLEAVEANIQQLLAMATVTESPL